MKAPNAITTKHRNGASCAALFDANKWKSFQLQGSFVPYDSLTRGSAPGPRWGLRAADPVLASRYTALASRHEPAAIHLFITFRRLCISLNTNIVIHFLLERYIRMYDRWLHWARSKLFRSSYRWSSWEASMRFETCSLFSNKQNQICRLAACIWLVEFIRIRIERE